MEKLTDMKEISLIVFLAFWGMGSCLMNQPHGGPLNPHPFHGQYPFFSDFNFFGGSGFPHAHDQPHNHDSNGFYSNGYDHHHGHGQAKIVCPEQAEDAYIATYSYNDTLYPLNEIALELALAGNAALFACLTTHSVPPDAPPTPENTILAKSTSPCNYVVNKLASFSKYGGLCWIINNFQEPVLYVRCQCEENKCKQCERGNDGYGYGYGYGYTKSVKRCVHSYRYESVWAYCEAQPVDNRIVRERIVVPQSCSCRSVECNTVYTK